MAYGLQDIVTAIQHSDLQLLEVQVLSDNETSLVGFLLILMVPIQSMTGSISLRFVIIVYLVVYFQLSGHVDFMQDECDDLCQTRCYKQAY